MDMTVLMTLRVPADPARLEQFAKDNPGLMSSISARGKEQGAISHRFYASSGTVMVLDEWPDEETFHKFFESEPEIKDIMTAAGASGPPEITFWTRLDVGDEF
jgi:quinol monooxygenase YgiN